MLLFVATIACFAGKPVGIVEGNSHQRLNELLSATVFNPQWTAEKPVTAKFDGDFAKFSAVIYLHGLANPFRIREWNAATIAAAEKYVSDGGTLFIIADGALNPGRGTGNLAKLLGAKKWNDFKGKAQTSDAAWAQCLKDENLFKHTLSAPGAALTELTTAKGIIGNESGFIVTENTLGSGKVYFINIRLSESYTPYPQPYHRRANAALEQFMPFAKQIHNLVMATSPQLDNAKRERWSTVPTGPAAVKTPWKKPVVKELKDCRQYADLPGEEIVLIRDGKAEAVIVAPFHSTKERAKVLNTLFQKMTGATLPVVGRAPADKAAIVFVNSAKVEVKAEGRQITIANNSESLYSFMRESLGYRMLWPGEYGEVYPTTKTVTVKPFSLLVTPLIRERNIRNVLARGMNPWKNHQGKTIKLPMDPRLLKICDTLKLDAEKVNELRKGHNAWWAVNRIGGRLPAVGGINFYGWNKPASKTPEDFFALQFNNTRKVGNNHLRVCKSHPGVKDKTVAELREKLAKNATAEYAIISPCDGGYDIFCLCEKCRKWDPTNATLYTHRVFLGRNRPVFRYPSFTDRVLRFTTEVANELSKTHPDIKPVYLAYASYFNPPEYFRNVPKNLMVSFVGLEYLNSDALAKDRENWDIWAGMAAEMRLRPNLLLSGETFPILYTKELDRDIKHCAATGMVAADFDSIPHNWAVHGLNYYVLAQLLWNPALPLETIVDDYCKSGFGPAAAAVKKYFNAVEKLTSQLSKMQAQSVKALEDLTSDKPAVFTDTAMQVYTPAKIAELEAMLAAASKLTAADSPERKRVEFLQAGLRFTKLRLEFVQKFKDTRKPKTLSAEAAKIFADMQDIFQRYPFAVDFPNQAGADYYAYWRYCK